MDVSFNSENDFYKSVNIKLGEGSEGVCYKHNNIVLKKFHDFYIVDKSIKKLLQFKNVESEEYYFNKGRLIINNKFSGLTMNYARGKLIEKCIIYQNFDDLISAAISYQKSTENISNKGINCYDMLFVNVLFDNISNKFKIVDTSDFYISDEDSKRIYQKNIQFLSQDIVNCMFNNILLKYINKSKKLNQIIEIENSYITLSGKIATLKEIISPVDVLKIIKLELQELCNQEINSVYDCIKKIRKV